MVIYESPNEDESLVIIELPTSAIRERKPENVAVYVKRFAAFQAAAISGNEAIQLIENIAIQMTEEAFRAS